MVKNQKEKDKAILQRNKYRELLAEIKKKKNPIIQSQTKQIKQWESDLKRGRRIQERLDSLEIKKEIGIGYYMMRKMNTFYKKSC